MSRIFVGSTVHDSDHRHLVAATIRERFTFPVRELTPGPKDAPLPEKIVRGDLLVIVVGPSTGRGEAAKELDPVLRNATEARTKLFLLVHRESGENLSPYNPEWVEAYDTPAELRSKTARAIDAWTIPWKRSVSSNFELAFSPRLTEEQVKATLFAIADYFRACGGVGLQAEFDLEDIAVKEPEGALV